MVYNLHRFNTPPENILMSIREILDLSILTINTGWVLPSAALPAGRRPVRGPAKLRYEYEYLFERQMTDQLLSIEQANRIIGRVSDLWFQKLICLHLSRLQTPASSIENAFLI